MIRCIPVDGSEPFEVDNDLMISYTHPAWGPCEEWLRKVAMTPHTVLPVRGISCRIESWRERAERLEKELAGLRHRIALDAMDKRRESERG